MKKSTKFSITLVGTTLLGNNPMADITSPADNPSAPTPQHVANDSFLSKLGIPADLRIARGATLKDTREGDTKPLSAASNDNLANAIPITALPYTSTIDTSLTSQNLETNERLPSCLSSGVPPEGYTSVWYQYTPTHDHSVVIQTTDSSYSPSLSVWTGTTHPLTQLDCGSSRLALSLTAGTSYYINVGTPANLRGTWILNMNEFQATQAPNDNLANATLITSLPYQAQQQVQWATREDTENYYPGCGQEEKSVWYQYTPTTNQTVTWELKNSGNDFSLWYGTKQPLTYLAYCDPEGYYYHSSFLTLKLTVDTTYYLRIAAADSDFLDFSLSVSPVTPPTNDNLANATVISTLPYYSNAALTVGSMYEDLEQLSSCGGETEADGSVWYQYTPTKNQTVRFWARSEPFNLILSVWSGTTHPLTELACFNSFADRNSATLSKLTAGTTYFIKVSGSSNQKSLVFAEVTLPSNDNLANATVISTLPYSNALETFGSTREDLELFGSCEGETEAYGSMWYQYTPPKNQAVEFSVPESYLPVSVWHGTTHPLTELACSNSYYGGTILSRLTVDTTYYIKVGSPSPSNRKTLVSFKATEVTLPNDNLANATVISTLPYSNTALETFGSTREDLELFGSCEGETEAYGSVWYQYTPPKNQAVEFSVPSGSYLSVWHGTTHPLTELACSNSYDGTILSRLTVDTTYYIKVGSPSNQKTLVSLVATEITPSSNDDLANATVIPALPYGHSQNTQGATVEPGEVNEFNYESNAGGCGEGYFIYGFGYSVRYQYTSSVWYQYTPDHDQLVEFDTLGSNYDTVLSVWTGTTHPLMPLTCNNNEYGGVLSQANLKLTAHTTYYIKVGSRMSLYDGDNGGILNLYAQEILPLSNDHLDQAIPITSLPYTHLQNTQGASLEAKEVTASCAKDTAMSVWYTYTPVTSQTVILDTQASSYDTVLSVWTGNSQPLTEIACHNDLSATNLQSKLSVTLTAGTTYSINVSSINGYYYPVSMGTLNLTVTANDLQLSPLGPANMIDALGNPVTSSTEVWGGISVNGSAYQAQVIENLSDEVEVWGKMKMDPNYVGQTAETVVYAIYKSSALVPEEYFYMVDNRYSIYPWDQNPANLMALQTVRLAPEQWQAIYRGRFQVPGVLDLFWGYRLADGTVVTNSQGLRVTINRQVN